MLNETRREEVDVEQLDGHTPGPWHPCRAGKCSCRMVWAKRTDNHVATSRNVACVHGEWGDGPGLIYGEVAPEEAEANAHLIAAAPDLLAKVRRLREELAEAIEARDFAEGEERRRCEDLESHCSQCPANVKLREENERLALKVDLTREEVLGDVAEERADYIRENLTLKAENARLREALREIEAGPHTSAVAIAAGALQPPSAPASSEEGK